MRERHLGSLDFARKAVAPLPTCVAVTDATAPGSLDVLIYALHDLATAGIVARLVLAGRAAHDHVDRLMELARQRGLQDYIHQVDDAGEFTLSRVYLFGQYFLSVGPGENPEITRDALRCGCIPIRRTGGYGQFFDEIERVIRSTFNRPAAFAALHGQISRTIDE